MATATPGEPSWASRHQEASDRAWAAWHRLGLDYGQLLDSERRTAAPVVSIAVALAKPMAKVAADLLEQMDDDLDRDALARIIEAAAIRTTNHALWALVESIGDEVARPGALPFDPPAAGAWLRCRSLPRPGTGRLGPRLAPEWDGRWHVFSGDLRPGDERAHEIYGRARCGATLRMRSFHLFDGRQTSDYVLAEERPTVDACGRCARPAAAPIV